MDILKIRGFETLPTLNQFVEKAGSLTIVKKYTDFLQEVPKRTDFIPYDDEGFLLADSEPIFAGWEVCEESSSETKKVAKFKDETNEYRIYFETKEGIIIISNTHMVDEVKYNDLAIFFEGKLKLV